MEFVLGIVVAAVVFIWWLGGTNYRDKYDHISIKLHVNTFGTPTLDPAIQKRLTPLEYAFTNAAWLHVESWIADQTAENWHGVHHVLATGADWVSKWMMRKEVFMEVFKDLDDKMRREAYMPLTQMAPQAASALFTGYSLLSSRDR